MPFIFVDGSSGCGKTQMAFSLMKAGRTVHYIPCMKMGPRTQLIYLCFESFAVLFLECIELDMIVLDKKDCPYECRSFSAPNIELLRLSIYGFILALFSDDKCYRGPALRGDVIQALYSFGPSNRPIVFLDEFPILLFGRNNESNENNLKFMRNIFRSLNIIVILSSTSSSAINLIKSSAGSRSSGIDDPFRLWCHVVVELPSYKIQTSLPDNNISKLIPLLQYSRPSCARFVEILWNRKYLGMIVDNMLNLMDSMMPYLTDYLKSSKHASLDYDEYFFHGQVCLFLSTSYIVPEENDVNNLLIHRHYANLVESDNFRLFIKDDLRSSPDATSKWIPNVKFPSLDKDILLYLSLLGGKNNYPIKYKESRVPFACAVNMLGESKVKHLNFSNSSQSSNDGMKMETILSSSLVLASHYNGFSGISFEHMLRELLYELSPSEKQHVPDMIVFPPEIKFFMDLVVPYLSPPNQSWPDYLTPLGLTLGNFKRTPNSSCIDMRVLNSFLTGECKDHNRPIDLPLMENILLRVPPESEIHLVLTNTIQKSYYTSSAGRSFKDFINRAKDHKVNLENCKIYEVVMNNKTAVLSEIDGLNLPVDTTPSRIIIFIAI